MDVDPMEAVEAAEEETHRERNKNRLNSLVAITVALLATFMGLCKVKADNIVQAMQKAESERVNSYAWYQARNIREEVMAATAAQMDAMAASTPAVNRAPLLKAAERYRSLAEDQKKKKQEQLDNANKLAKDYDALNVHDDQFDLSDAFLAIAISLLALTALTQKRWLYGMAMLPTVFGIYMGLAGLLGWGVRFSFFSKLLGT